MRRSTPSVLSERWREWSQGPRIFALPIRLGDGVRVDVGIGSGPEIHDRSQAEAAAAGDALKAGKSRPMVGARGAGCSIDLVA